MEDTSPEATSPQALAERIEERTARLARTVQDIRHETAPKTVVGKAKTSTTRTIRRLLFTEEGTIRAEVVIGVAVVVAGIVTAVVLTHRD